MPHAGRDTQRPYCWYKYDSEAIVLKELLTIIFKLKNSNMLNVCNVLGYGVTGN